MKLTVRIKPYGYSGTAFADALERLGIVCEFADPDFLVLMLTPETDIDRLEKAMLAIERGVPQSEAAPKCCRCEQVCTPREAMLAPSEKVPVELALGRVLASPSVGCPPAVPVVICGERITGEALDVFRYYGITHCRVMK
jgi:arginine/lysine/ornithine decarboxylase